MACHRGFVSKRLNSYGQFRLIQRTGSPLVKSAGRANEIVAVNSLNFEGVMGAFFVRRVTSLLLFCVQSLEAFF